MPCKNIRKTYQENSYYHIYNRGVEKRNIFEDEQDYSVFLSYIKTYLTPKNEEKLRQIITFEKSTSKEKDQATKLLRLNNFCTEIKLICYCLMPNHFHFLIKQKSETSIDYFMNSLGTRYTLFFNKKYKRVGPLYQSTYKAVLVESEQQLLWLSHYIHRNPTSIKQPSSLPEYLEQRKTEWVYSKEILSYFSKTNKNLSYKTFIQNSEDPPSIKDITIDI